MFLLATRSAFKKEKVGHEVLVKKKGQGRPLLQTQSGGGYQMGCLLGFLLSAKMKDLRPYPKSKLAF